MKTNLRTTLMLVIINVLTTLSFMGCQRPTVVDPLTERPIVEDADPAATQLDFWHSLPERRMVSNDEAFRGVLLVMDGQDEADYAARISNLKNRGWLPQSFDEPGNLAVSRGHLAVVLAHAIELRGGLTMMVLGPTPRYATREMQYVGLYPPSSPHQTFTGDDFMAVMGRIEDYQRIHAKSNVVKSDAEMEKAIADQPQPSAAPEK